MNSSKDNLWSNVHQASKIYLLPNFFTAGNLFFGFLSMVLCIRGRFDAVANSAIDKIAQVLTPIVGVTDDPSTSYYLLSILCILISVFCDALDGRVARAVGKSSLFGKEFDSIADVVSFGVAPALLMVFLILRPVSELPESVQSIMRGSGFFVSFVFLLCAAVRLSRFNVLTCPYIAGHEKYEHGDFCGMPAPAAAGVVASISLTLLTLNMKSYILLLIPLMLLIAWFMISNIPYPSFKHINWNTSTKFRSFIILVACALLIIYFKEYSFSIIFLAYAFYAPIKYLPRAMKIIRYARKRKLVKKS